MSSILTNAAAMTALKSLQSTNKSIEMTQARISTGMQVAEASDNAAYWSIATTMRSDSSALSTVQDALGLGAAKVDVAYTGINAALDVVDEIKTKLVAASEPGVDRSKIQSEISELQSQLSSIAESATFSGENWLSVDSSVAGYSSTKSVVASFNRASDGSVSLATIDIDTTTTVLFDAGTATTEVGLLDTEYTANNGAATPVAVTYTIATLDITAANVDDTVLADMISRVDETVEALTTSASDLGTSKKRINLQSTFVGDLMDAIERGIGKLVDADMTEESTRLQALQVQQQLGVQSLSIANGNAQTILSLFQG